MTTQLKTIISIDKILSKSLALLLLMVSFVTMQLRAQDSTIVVPPSLQQNKTQSKIISPFQYKVQADAQLDAETLKPNPKAVTNTSKPTSLSDADSAGNIIIVPQSVRKGLFAWRDSVVIPKRSAFYALIFPGLGQLNNKDYWKLPIVYGALGVGVYFFIDNSSKYNIAREEIAYRMDKGNSAILHSKYSNWDLQTVQQDRDHYKRLLDMTVLISVAGYGLQVMEANAAAHLKGFDVSDDISMQFRPSAIPTPYGIIPGVTVAFKLK